MFQVFSVFDKKSKTFSQLITSRNSLTVVRELQGVSADHPWRKFAEDFQLHEVGIFEESIGLTVGEDGAKFVYEMSVVFPKEG